MTALESSVQESPSQVKCVGVRQLFLLSLPLMILSASSSLAIFFENFFLVNFSTEAWQAYAVGHSLVAVFQITCMRMAIEAQVFVSQACSSNSEKSVGIYIWQMIWVSILSSLVVLPLSIFAQNIYFDSSALQQEAKEYFQWLMLGNFLFPLAISLSAFYSGRKKQFHLFLATLFIFSTHLLLAATIIPIMGLKGAAISSLATQAIYCLVLLTLILGKKNRQKYGTNNWKLQRGPLLATLKIGAFNGLSALTMSLSWTIIVAIVKDKGSDFLTIIAFGNSCALFVCFFNLGLGQAVAISASGLIGAKQFDAIGQLLRSTLAIISMILIALFPFLVLFPEFTLKQFFPNFPDQFSPELASVLCLTCQTMWFFEVSGSIDRVSRGMLTASGDTIYMFMVHFLFMWIGTCLPVYLAIQYWNLSPQGFWPLVTAGIFLRNVPLILRIKQQRWRIKGSLLAN